MWDVAQAINGLNPPSSASGGAGYWVSTLPLSNVRYWLTADGHEPSGDEPREVWTGTIERTFSGMGGRGIGMGGMMAGSFFVAHR